MGMFPLRFTTLQRRFLMVATVLCIVWALGFKFLTMNYTRTDSPVYSGTYGPYLIEDDGTFSQELHTYHPGQRIGWYVAICYEPGTVGEAITDMVDHNTGKLVSSTITPLAGGELPCSAQSTVARLVARVLPFDLPPGEYEMRRRVVLGVGDNRPVIHIMSPFISFKVVNP